MVREIIKGSVCWKVVVRRATVKFQLCGVFFCQDFPVLSSLDAEQEQLLYQHKLAFLLFFKVSSETTKI